MIFGYLSLQKYNFTPDMAVPVKTKQQFPKGKYIDWLVF